MKTPRFLLASIYCSATLLLFSTAMLWADVTATILGNVRDQSSAAIPNATIVATNLDTNQSQQTNTDITGRYQFLALPVGRYRVEAIAAGFFQGWWRNRSC